VPAWGKVGEYAEWYWHHVASEKTEDAVWRDFHTKNYGKDFPYQNFAPRFTAELFDAPMGLALCPRRREIRRPDFQAP
jgi:alpha-L-fucosidase